uniref:Uncharacterized protein n=1 Tax=Rousettus aegyptiacus TaxID=9407 RepID=A0A7J8GAA9_ROUAE|nr:hypothetical protein HJG63_011639 [Rousettus aegyptiacus]
MHILVIKFQKTKNIEDPKHFQRKEKKKKEKQAKNEGLCYKAYIKIQQSFTHAPVPFPRGNYFQFLTFFPLYFSIFLDNMHMLQFHSLSILGIVLTSRILCPTFWFFSTYQLSYFHFFGFLCAYLCFIAFFQMLQKICHMTVNSCSIYSSTV